MASRRSRPLDYPGARCPMTGRLYQDSGVQRLGLNALLNPRRFVIPLWRFGVYAVELKEACRGWIGSSYSLMANTWLSPFLPK